MTSRFSASARNILSGSWPGPNGLAFAAGFICAICCDIWLAAVEEDSLGRIKVNREGEDRRELTVVVAQDENEDGL
jgi:hypothetical protein